MGGTDTNVHEPIMSPIQKPGQVTKGMMHKCKHIGTRPPAGIGSSLDWGVVQRGNIEEQCILMYDEKHLRAGECIQNRLCARYLLRARDTVA